MWHPLAVSEGRGRGLDLKTPIDYNRHMAFGSDLPPVLPCHEANLIQRRKCTFTHKDLS